MKQWRTLITASLIQWVPLAVATVGISILVYVAVQQTYRSSANDPQIQMAQDASAALIAGASPQSLVAANKVDLAHSLAPFLIIYDANGQVVATSATLDNQTPQLPSGVFTTARHQSPDLITWQPALGVRSAIAVVAYPNGYVLAGRSLLVIEQREDALGQWIFAACGLILVGTLFTVLAMRWLAQHLPEQTTPA
jgi:hypothetical protein